MRANMFGNKQRMHDLPDDLRQSLGSDTLARLAVDAAQIIALQKSLLADPGGAQSNPQSLLAILTYCYAAGVFDSHKVEWACHHDPALRSLCADKPPHWPAIWRFRNANRPWIEESLARVYDAVCRGVPAGGQYGPGTGPQSEAAPSADLVDFARRKVRQAARIDSSLYE